MRKHMILISLMLTIALLMGCTENEGTAGEVQGETLPVQADVQVEETVSGNLHVLGRASVRIDLDDGRVVYIDPFAGKPEDYDKAADLVLVTHQHSDHNITDRVTLKATGEIVECPMDIRPGDVLNVQGFEIIAVAAYNENHDPNVSSGFIIKTGGLTIYHSGDTSMTDQMVDFGQYDLDYALLCMDGYYNMGPEEASMVADLIESQVVIPIHTSGGGEYDQATADAFIHDAKLDIKPGESVELVDLSKAEIPFEIAIEGILEDRLKAIETQDYDLYMSAITRRNPYFYNEQERWFMGMIDDRIKHVTLEIVSTEMLDETSAVVTLHQTHEFDRTYDFTYPLLFKYENGLWKDHGYHFEIYRTDLFTIKYMPGETRVEEFAGMLKEAFDNLYFLYDEKPHPYFEMKLFTDQELLRQRTIPANGTVFTGWSEPDESLKLFTGHSRDYNGYPGVVQHEVVHHITIRICNNNLPVWMLEGIAMYDGSAPHGLENSGLLRELSKRSVKMGLNKLESLDLTNPSSREEVFSYYNTSYMYTRYIVETYGREAMMALFYEAGKKPFHDSTLNAAHDEINKVTAGEVLETVLGLSKEDLTFAYLEWLNAQEWIQ